MIVKMIKGCTRVLGKAQGFLGLPVRDVELEGCAAMVTAWEPTPAELDRLNAGAPVMLTLLGTGHPPVKLEVGDAP